MLWRGAPLDARDVARWKDRVWCCCTVQVAHGTARAYVQEDEASTSGEEGAEEARPELGLKAQIQVLWGNVLFERSQVRHHRDDKKWQVDTDAAVAKFNEAGCSKDDITKALMNHTSGVWQDDEEAAKTKAGGK